MMRLRNSLGSLVLILVCAIQLSAEDLVKLNTDFPGGNLQVISQDESRFHVEPDLRGDRPWFYWYFEAKVEKPTKATFVFPEKVIGFKNGAIGFQGPAISKDQGKTWKWMGTETVKENAFDYEFTKAGEIVRFAVTIPYVQANLDEFLKEHSGNSHLKQAVLTKSRKGREVTLLHVPSSEPDAKKLIITGRHHAAETIASYVIEGFVAEAMSDSPTGKAFRKKYSLHAIPIVDRDGVEEGDQGKNRKPHDHNRDYGEKSIYPEVQAIKDLAAKENFQFALDFHCPTLVMDSHQVLYFVGAKTAPPHNLENVTEFASWIKAALPKDAPAGPMVWLKDETDPSPKNSRYFAFQEGSMMSATIEIPFAPPKKKTDVESCRKYGQLMLRAFTETHFRSDEANASK